MYIKGIQARSPQRSEYAVFGVEGALLMMALLHRGKLAGVTTGRIAFSIAFSLYCGFTSRNVDNAAHIGGLLMGFLMAGIFWLFMPGEKGQYLT